MCLILTIVGVFEGRGMAWVQLQTSNSLMLSSIIYERRREKIKWIETLIFELTLSLLDQAKPCHDVNNVEAKTRQIQAPKKIWLRCP